MAYETITLCGSGKFKKEFKEVYLRLTLEGNTVLTPAIFDHPEDMEITPEMHENYDRIHRDKIEKSDRIYVVNPNGYIGKDTKEEIEFAIANNIPVDYLEYTPASVPVIMVLGAQKFITEIRDYADRITREGNVVFINPMFNNLTCTSIGSNIHSDDIKVYEKIRKTMIRMSDTVEVYVGKAYYVDDKTWEDVEYAIANGKSVSFDFENESIRTVFHGILKKYGKWEQMLDHHLVDQTVEEISKELIPEGYKTNFEIGDRVKVISGDFYDQKGTIKTCEEADDQGILYHYVSFDYPNKYDGDDDGICHKIPKAILVKVKED